MITQETINRVSSRLRDRAEASRRVYNVTVVGIVVVAFALISLFISGALKGMEFSGEPSMSAVTIHILSIGIVRIGAVAVGVYSIQILFSFARYHIRLSQHLSCVADALEMCEGDTSLLESLIRSTEAASLDFGKAPASPMEKLPEVIQELIKKIPNQIMK